jgi:hypothetical protein
MSGSAQDLAPIGMLNVISDTKQGRQLDMLRGIS